MKTTLQRFTLRGLFLAALLTTVVVAKSAVFTVTNTSDGAGTGTLRQAITDANAAVGADVIQFAIGTGAQSITLGSNLPVISSQIFIDGTTQPGYAGTPLITLKFEGTILNISGTASGVQIKALGLVPASAGSGFGTGLISSGCQGLIVQNCLIDRKAAGLIITGGSDAQVRNNTFTNTGSFGSYSLAIDGVGSVSIPSRILVDGNTFSGGEGIRLVGMPGQIIGDAGVSGANVVLADGSLGGLNGTVLELTNAANVVVDNVDFTRTITSVSGYGISASGCNNIILKNNTVANRLAGISVSSGSDLQVLNNTFSNSGVSNLYSLDISNVAPVSISSRIQVSGNSFSAPGGNGIRLVGMPGQVIGDVNVPGANVVLADASLGGITATVLELNNTDNVVVDNVDFTRTLTALSGFGINTTGCDNIILKNSTFANRLAGLLVTGGSDLQVLNNTFSNSGAGTLFSIEINGVTGVGMASGIAISGNSFTAVGGSGIRLQNMTNQVIKDAGAAGANIVLADGSLSGLAGTVLNLTNVDNVIVDNIDFSRAVTTVSGTGLETSGCDNIIVQSCGVANRIIGMSIFTGSDAQVLNNTFSNSGAGGSFSLALSGVSAVNLPRRILVSGNSFSATGGNGVRLDNMPRQYIGDAGVTDANVVLPDASLSGLSGTVLYLGNTDSSIVENLDLSRAITTAGGNGIETSNCDSLVIKNNTIGYRQYGILAGGGSNLRILNNAFSNSGANGGYCIYLNSIAASVNLPSRIQLFGNAFTTGNGNGIALINLTGQIMGDAGVSGTNVVLPDGALGNIAGTVLSLNNVDVSVIDNLDFSRALTSASGVSIEASGCDNLIVRNCTTAYRQIGFNLNGGSDVQILDNAFSNSGTGGLSTIYIQNVSAGAMPKRILATGNSFTSCGEGIYMSNMTNQTIGDPSVSGANVVVADGVFHNISGTALVLANIDSSVVDNIDAGRPSATGSTGITAQSGCAALTIQNCTINNRNIALNISTGTDIKVLNNNLNNTGLNGFYAVYLNGITAAALPGGLLVTGNTFTGAGSGIALSNTKNQVIGDASVTGANVVLADGSLNSISALPLALNNVDSSTIDNIDAGRTTGTGSGGIDISGGCDVVTIKNCTVSNRNVAISVTAGSEITLNNNRFVNCGLNGSAALALNNVGAGPSMPRRISVKNTTYNSCGTGLYLLNMSNLIIGDMTVPDANIRVCADDSLVDVTGTMIQLNNISNSRVEHINLSYAASNSTLGTGLAFSGTCSQDTIRNVIICSRVTGISVSGAASGFAFAGNSIKNCTTGLVYNSTTAPLPLIANNTFAGNTTALNNANNTVTLNAANNYWGAANGPSNLGGSGNGYTGLVTASPFLSAEDASVPAEKGTFLVSRDSLLGFSSSLCSASAAQTFAVRGQCLESNVVMTAPAGFEFSINGTTYTNALTIPVSGGNITGEPLTIYARLARICRAARLQVLLPSPALMFALR